MTYADEALRVTTTTSPCDGVRVFTTLHVNRPLVDSPLGNDKLFEPADLADLADPDARASRGYAPTPFGRAVLGAWPGLESLLVGRYRIRMIIGALFDREAEAVAISRAVAEEWRRLRAADNWAPIDATGERGTA